MTVLRVSKRKSYFIKYKQDAVRAIEDLHASGLSVMAACKGLNLPHYYYGRWKKLLKNIDELDASNKAASKPAVIAGVSQQFHHGRPGILQAVENDLTHALFELREQGLQVNTQTVRKEASHLNENFWNKTLLTKKAIVYRFLKRLALTHHVSTHVAQKDHHKAL